MLGRFVGHKKLDMFSHKGSFDGYVKEKKEIHTIEVNVCGMSQG